MQYILNEMNQAQLKEQLIHAIDGYIKCFCFPVDTDTPRDLPIVLREAKAPVEEAEYPPLRIVK